MNPRLFYRFASNLLLLPVFLLFVCLNLGKVCYAQSGVQVPKDKLNVVLLLDTSASMLVNDPTKLRIEGARLLLQFLKSGDSLSIIGFDQEAKILRSASPFSSDQIPAVMTILNSLEASGQYTDLNAGLLKAIELLKANAKDDLKPVIVLLSDGKMDPAPSRGTVESHLDSLTTAILPSLKTNAFSVYSLSFSADADKALLQHIAQASDGVNWFTPNSETIHESFADLFLSLKKPQVVPSSAKGFKIETNIEEATFYVNQSEGVKIQLESPDEEVFSADESPDYVRWFEGKKFSVITISNPIAGDWKLIGVNPDEGFATILTNLKLVTDWPNAVPVGEKVTIQARLFEGKLPVDLQAISEAVTFAFQITPSDRVSEPIVREFLNDLGENGDEKAADGVFSHELKLTEAGEYRLRILAKGPTFERQLQIPFRVRPPLVNIHVNDPSAGLLADEHSDIQHADKDSHEKAAADHTKPEDHAEATDHGKTKVIDGSNTAVFEVSLNEEASTLKDVHIKVVAIDKKRNKYTIDAKSSKASQADKEHGHSEEDSHSKDTHKKDPHAKDSSHAKDDAHSKDSQPDLTYYASATALPADGLYELKAYLTAKSRDGKSIEEESEIVKFNRKTVVDVSKHQVEVKTEEPKEELPPPVQESAVDVVSLILITVINLGLAAGLFFMLKKNQTAKSSGSELELPEESKELKAKVEALEKLVLLDSVDLKDPRFNEVIAKATTETKPPASQEIAAEEPALEEGGEANG